MEKYINDRIRNMITSKLSFHSGEIKHYFKHRHGGLAGIDGEMVCDLVRGAIRDYKVWTEMQERNRFHVKMMFYNKHLLQK